MATLYNDRTTDTTHANHPTLDAVSSQFIGRAENYVDPIYGFTTAYDFVEYDLTGIPEGTRLTFRFRPNDAYFFRVTGRLDDDANLHSTAYFPGSNLTIFNHDPTPGAFQVHPSGTYTWTVPDLSNYDHPALELQIVAGGFPSGGLPYTALDYTLTTSIPPLRLYGVGDLSEIFDNHREQLRDAIRASLGDDVVWSGQKDDSDYGGYGRDVIIGDRGNDIMQGDNGSMSKGDNDQLLGGYGKDTMHGNGGRDYLNGEWDHDTLFGDNGNDLMYGGFGTDNLYGGNGNDVLYGGSAVHPNGAWFGRPIVVDHEGGTGRSIRAQAWSIAGEAQATDTSSDYLSGGAGNDVLYGQGGRDRLIGGSGDDKLIGGLHRDVMTGGTGKDTFVFNSTHDSYSSHPDVITDFQHGVDKIDLSAIDANPTRPGNQVLAFIGLKPFGSAHGEVRWDGSHVYVDLNSDGTPDMSFVVAFRGTHKLDKYDFVL